MSKVLCFGELLLRFSPSAQGEWLSNNQMPVFVGGAELNVATALSTWGVPVKYCTAVPDHSVSRDILSYLEKRKIDTSPILFSGDRLGLYFLSAGSDMKSAATIFDRKNSSFATLATGQLKWDSILEDVSWFHFSAIAPGLSRSAAALCKEALEAASKKNIPISVDLNYRPLLWKYGCQAQEIMPVLVKYCDVVMGNLWSANTLLGIPLETSLQENSTLEKYIAHATATAAAIMSINPKCKFVANTFRFHENHEAVKYYATLNTAQGQTISPTFHTQQVVEKVGSGDCFMAGLIYGIINKHPLSNIISFAAAAAFGKLHEKGDTTNNSINSIQHIISKHSLQKNSIS